MKTKNSQLYFSIVISSIIGISIYLSLNILGNFTLELAKYLLSKELSINIIKDVDSEILIIIKIITIISIIGGAYFLTKFLLKYLELNHKFFLIYPIIICTSFLFSWENLVNSFNEISILSDKYYVYYHFNFFQDGNDELNLIYKSSNKIKLPLFYLIFTLYLGLLFFTFLSFISKELLKLNLFSVKIFKINIALGIIVCFSSIMIFHYTAMGKIRNSDFYYYSKFNPESSTKTNLDKNKPKVNSTRKECSGLGNEGCISLVRQEFAKTGKNILGEQYLGEGKFGISFMDSQHPGVYDATISTDCNCNIIDTKVKAVR